MKTLRISHMEIRNLKIPPMWPIAANSYFNFWIESKLREAGFDLSKKYISCEDCLTLELVFKQEETQDE